ncbi:MAG: hypothetical protein HS113_07700 [Verrucomicrobiales bacterium]|nr:hypothetical protein [Verrucomicrobiales bacterium]
MKTKTLLPNLLRWCGGLALALGWLAPAVLAQGIATQTLTWTGAAGRRWRSTPRTRSGSAAAACRSPSRWSPGRPRW